MACCDGNRTEAVSSTRMKWEEMLALRVTRSSRGSAIASYLGGSAHDRGVIFVSANALLIAALELAWPEYRLMRRSTVATGSRAGRHATGLRPAMIRHFSG